MSLIKLFFGRTKSGKSYKAEKMLRGKSKVIVYDYAHCFKGKVVTDFSVNGLTKLLINHGGPQNKNKTFKLIFRKPHNITHHDAVERLALFVLHLGRSYGYRTLPDGNLLTFLVDEADKCTTNKADDRVRLAVQAGRHDNVATWAIAQRPMNLHKDFRDNASEVFCFKCGENPYYREILGRVGLAELAKMPEYGHIRWTDTGELKKVSARGGEKDVPRVQ